MQLLDIKKHTHTHTMCVFNAIFISYKHVYKIAAKKYKKERGGGGLRVRTSLYIFYIF
jgi:hypothetical protein